MNDMKTAKGTILPILSLKGKPYLQVAHRVVWCREEHPDWVFEVSFIEINDKFAFAKATISDAEGKVRAIAHKVEHFSHFADAIEKAETGAIGRALAMIGYGTQFAPDIDEEDRIVDTPISPAKPKVESPLKKLGDEREELARDPGKYVFTFGKFSKEGRPIKELDVYALNNYLKYINDEAEKKGRPLSGKALEAVEICEAFLKTKEFAR